MITKIIGEKVQIERGNEYERGENRGGYEDENYNGGRFYVCMYIKGGQQVEARTHSPKFITTIITIHLCNLSLTFLSVKCTLILVCVLQTFTNNICINQTQ